ncbi:adenosylcobinamide-phosphate synthase CbiB [Rubrimonas cliftonensis]|uniref:Cobalamin biosynthesis protein CobD n=1 Tax=Rubrimonas cliftonensis TaxID=89524 RepID=A0A1H4EI53_9RHOB|nr:adenosylcobinamide-phosphate synthase CbiB [Rubrimonas cliftonensis]SEA84509.1 adenosylcobinamide-phosphate synthase [Rubrimonas cliftonensis]
MGAFAQNAAAMLAALALEAVVGWPERLHRRIGHPVTWVGALIAALERRLNRGGPRARLAAGWGVCVGVVGLAALAGAAVEAMAAHVLGGAGLALALGVAAWPLIAARSLDDHVRPVAVALAAEKLDAARAGVSRIVGRDPERLDAPGVARAALESLAENASDGVVAPLFWGALLGLPGLAAYKALNTLDSMIGHRTPRHVDFGRASARLDDLANLVPARLTGLLIALAGGRPRASLRTMALDARRHRSPNAGWPEAAMAGALGVRLSGPRAYAGGLSDEPWLNGAAPDPDAAALMRGLRVYRLAMALAAALLLGGATWL